MLPARTTGVVVSVMGRPRRQRAARAASPPRPGPLPAPRRGGVAEEILESVTALLDPDERQAELGDDVADEVVGPLVDEVDEDGRTVDDRLEAGGRQSRGEGVTALVDLDGQRPDPLHERSERCRPEQLAALDRHEVVADALDLAEEMRGHDHGDPELRAGSVDELEHLVTAGRVEPVRRLVEQEQPRVVDQRLGELDPLAHPRAVAADRPVPLLVQPDVAQDLGGPLAGRGPGQPGDLGEVGDDVGRRHVRRQAVVLGHVADELADRDPVRRDVEVEDQRRAARRRDEPEQDLQERALARAVRPDEPDDAGLDLERQAVERGDRALRIASSGHSSRSGSPRQGIGPDRSGVVRRPRFVAPPHERVRFDP